MIFAFTFTPSSDAVTWMWRSFLIAFILLSGYELFHPNEVRQWHLRKYERHPWIASEKIRNRLRNKSEARLRIEAALGTLASVVFLLISFGIFR